ncbi:MAG: hypothetical protein ACK2T7_02235 [Anaerolineales bacterium]
MSNRFFWCLIFLVITVSLVACGADSPEPTRSYTVNARPSQPPTAAPTATYTLTPTETSVPTLTPAEISSDAFNIGPFERVWDLDPEIFGPKPWYDAKIWHDYENDITTIEGWNGIARVLPETIQTKVVAEGYQLIGYDDDSLAYIIGREDGMIYQVDLDMNGQPLPEGWQPVQNPESLKGMGVITDIDGNNWLATHFDVRRFDGQKWTIWTRTDLGMDPRDNEMVSPMEIHGFDLLQGLWLTSCDYGGPGPNGGGGARWWDGSNWQGAGSPVDTGCVTSVFQDEEGIYWIGVEHELWQYNSINNSWQAQPYITAPDPYYRAYAHQIFVSPQGIPWVSFNLCGGASCYDFQLAYYQNNTWQMVGEIAFMPHKILFSPVGDVWLFDPYGLYKFENGEMVLVSEIFPLAGVFDRKDRLWLVGMDSEYIPALWVEIIE